MVISAELADKGLLGCTSVVGFKSRKWARFAGALCAISGSDWLLGLVQVFQ